METPPPISRSGRVLKKSAKLLEMETETASKTSKNAAKSPKYQDMITPSGSIMNAPNFGKKNSTSNNFKMKLNLSGELQPPLQQPNIVVRISDLKSTEPTVVNLNNDPTSSNSYQPIVKTTFLPRNSPAVGSMIFKLKNQQTIVAPKRETSDNVADEDAKRVRLTDDARQPLVLTGGVQANDTKFNSTFTKNTLSPIVQTDSKERIQNSFASSTPKNTMAPSSKMVLPRSIQEQRRINQANKARLQQQQQQQQQQQLIQQTSSSSRRPTTPIYNHNQSLYIEEENSKRKKPSISAYVLWCKEMRSHIQSNYPELDFANLSKKMGEIWHTLPQNEKNTWFKKASIMTHGSIGSDGIRPLKPSFVYDDQYLKPDIVLGSLTLPITADLNKVFKEHFSKNDDNNVLFEGEQHRIGTELIDAQAYLSILGDSLMTISSYIQRGIKYNSEIRYSPMAAVSTLLDTALVSMGAMTSLTLSLPNVKVDKAKIKKTIDNVTYFMPPADFS